MESFITVFDDALSSSECDSLIEWFEDNDQAHEPGRIGIVDENGQGTLTIDRETKHSTDLSVSFDTDDLPNKFLLPVLTDAIRYYIKQYPFMNELYAFSLDELYNLQRYYPNEGYFKEHCENATPDETGILAWTVYLNDVTDGGETLFTLYKEKLSAKQGRLVIFPAYWTHAHKGIVSPTQTKYIATGWFSYDR